MPKIGEIKTQRTPDGKKEWTSVYTSSGWKASKAMPAKGAKNTKKDDRSPAAAAAVVSTVQRLGNQVGSALETVKFGGKSGGSKSNNSGSQPSSSSGGAASSAPPKPAKPPKPGRVYSKTRAAYKSEKENQPTRYETPEQAKARSDKSQFDMDMSGADVKKFRKEYLKSHPAAAKAVAKGTLSMGDINMTVRRLKKKNPGAIGLNTTDG